MQDSDLASYQAAVIAADWQRQVQASWLAECELGPAPNSTTDRDAYIDYVARHNQLARDILGRLN